MICTGCYRDVPDLVGPAEDLCPECFGVAAEDLVPSMLAAYEHGHGFHGSFWDDFAADFAEYIGESDESDEENDWDSLLADFEEELDPFDGPPSFRGKPRF